MSNFIRSSSIALVLSFASSLTALVGCGASADPSSDEPVASTQAAITCVPRYDDPTHCAPAPPAPKGPTPAPTSTTVGKTPAPPVKPIGSPSAPASTCEGVPAGYVCVCDASGDCSVEPGNTPPGSGEGPSCESLPDDFICVCSGMTCTGLPFEH